MQAKRLGRTGLQVSIVGLGTLFLGLARDSGVYGSTPMDEDAGIATVHAAVEAGCTLIDTAPLYTARRSGSSLGRFSSGPT